MKKFLMNFATISLVATVSSQVAACGPATFAKLMARKVDPTIYRGTFAAPMSSWSVATTQTASDNWILTNANDMLLSVDQYNNFEGDLADNWGPTAYIGNDSSGADQEFRAWSFHVREGELAPVWTGLDRQNFQSSIRPIVARDFFNAFRFIFNPNNIAQTVGVWQQVLDYGSDLNAFLTYLRTDPKIGENPYPDLFNPLFSRNNDPGSNNGVVQSSFYIDRAILAFNLEPVRADDLAGMMRVRERALNLKRPANQNFNFLAEQNEDFVNESFTEGKIINSGKGTDNFNLTFNLLKPAEYFESMASFSSFAPLPDEAVDYLNVLKKNMAGTNYGSSTPNGELGYQRIYYSGAYVVKDYNPSLKLVMTKNKYYFNRDNVPISTLSYSYVGGVDISRQRFYFETGDLSEFMISSSDLSGWKKYVGSDFANPRFPGTNIVNRPQAGTQALFFNYRSTREEPQTEKANQAIAQRSTRAFMRYIFNRSEAAKFYSKARDGSDPVSHNLRNTWTAPNGGIWRDNNQPIDYVKFLYQDYMKLPDNDQPKPPDSGHQTVVDWLKQRLAIDEKQFDNWQGRFGSAEEESSGGEKVTTSSWVDGFDAYLRNDLIGAYAFLDDDRMAPKPASAQANSERFQKYISYIGDYSPEAEAQKLNLIKEQVRADLASKNIATSPVTLIFLANGSTSTGLNNYIKQAAQSFNFSVGQNSPINLAVVESKDAADYSTMLDQGKFSLIIFGWISDYADPYGFLHAMVYNGDLGEYAGFSRLFDDSKTTNDEKTLATNEVKLKVKAGVENPEAYLDFQKRLEYFTNKSADIDLNDPSSPTRYTKMAEIENYSILESMINIPMFTQYLDNVPYVSYVNPFTRTTFASGSPIYRFVGVSMVNQLWDHATFNSEKQKYEAARGRYQSKYPGSNGRLITVIDGDWRKSNT